MFALLVPRPWQVTRCLPRFLRHRLVGKVQRYSERNGVEPRRFVDSYWSQLRESKMTFSSGRVFGHRGLREENFAELNTTSKHLLFSSMLKRTNELKSCLYWSVSLAQAASQHVTSMIYLDHAFWSQCTCCHFARHSWSSCWSYSLFVLKMDQCRWDVYPEKWGAFMRASPASL